VKSWSTELPKPICPRAMAQAGSSATAFSMSRATSLSRSSWATCDRWTLRWFGLHSSCFTGDLLDSLRCDCGDQLHMALQMIGAEGVGALIYLPQEGRGIGLIEKIRAYRLQDEGLDTVQANNALGFRADPRDYGIGLQILKDLGLSEVRLLTNNPKKTDAFVYYGYDLKVVDQVPIVAPAVPSGSDTWRRNATRWATSCHRMPVTARRWNEHAGPMRDQCRRRSPASADRAHCLTPP